jgi:hypothetical protein
VFLIGYGAVVELFWWWKIFDGGCTDASIARMSNKTKRFNTVFPVLWCMTLRIFDTRVSELFFGRGRSREKNHSAALTTQSYQVVAVFAVKRHLQFGPSRFSLTLTVIFLTTIGYRKTMVMLLNPPTPRTPPKSHSDVLVTDHEVRYCFVRNCETRNVLPRGSCLIFCVDSLHHTETD